MKRFLTVCLTWLALGLPAYAGVSCSLPFTLVNNTLADATQVMANYNALVTCLNSAANAGANSDITSISGLTTPLSVSQGGTSSFIGGTSTGSANAQIIASTTPNTFQLVNGYRVIFKAGFTNAGATQVNVNAQGLTNVFRRTSDGIQALVGGEIILNALTEIVYDGTQFQLIAAVSPFPVGTVLDTIAAAADPGFLLMQGQCVSNTTFVALFVKMGSPAAGGCTAGNFALPDGRGRVVAQIDSGGSGRVTVAGGNFDGTVLYGAGGQQNRTLAQANLPNIVPTITFRTTGNAGAASAVDSPANSTTVTTPGGAVTYQSVSALQGTISSINGNVTQTTVAAVQPTVLLNRQVKY